MKVLIVGYPKTGTKTMYAALTLLGYKCYDYSHNFYYLRKEWYKIFTEGGTKEDFYRMYKDVDASMDTPACVFWENILEAFPYTKLIFMERESEDEYIRSLTRNFDRVNGNWMMTALALLSPTAFALAQHMHHVDRITFAGVPSFRFYRIFSDVCPTVAKRLYRIHNDSVMRRAPKDQLLIYSLSDGWDPLCKFLGVPVPSRPFPHKNRGGEILEVDLASNPMFFRMKKEAAISLCVIICIVAVLCFYCF